MYKIKLIKIQGFFLFTTYFIFLGIALNKLRLYIYWYLYIFKDRNNQKLNKFQDITFFFWCFRNSKVFLMLDFIQILEQSHNCDTHRLTENDKILFSPSSVKAISRVHLKYSCNYQNLKCRLRDEGLS